ncbi:hypothetical protein [uncultured Draconibacterium sp.]|uniref:hypothetical protein n=1 Tax=uncultured Draconibacterium sp. TaxID=1573823 RepID=UPI0032166F22
MKKILFIIIAGLAILINACTPMADINDEIDIALEAANKDAQFLKDLQVAPEAYTLTDEDYELSSNSSVANYKNFSASALPKDFLPEILNQKFSGEDAQAMMVTYNYYSKPVVDEDNAYGLSDTDYESMGQTYHNFSDEDVAKALIAKLLDRIVYAEDAGAEKTVEYTLYSTYEDRYIKINEDGTSEEVSYDANAVEVTDDIYTATGNGKYKNFYAISDALEDLAKYAVDSAVTLPVTYSALVYKNYLPEFLVFYYNGTNWEVKQSVMAVSEPLNYALNSDDISLSYWWADPAIKITLGGDDYAIYSETSKYGNFDLRGSVPPGTDRDKLVEMIGGMLDANHSPVEGQQYLVSYAYYDGSNGVATIRIIKENGTWSEVE